jgi:hypothetical protein
MLTLFVLKISPFGRNDSKINYDTVSFLKRGDYFLMSTTLIIEQ